jgi:hypothetical protein
MTVTFRDSLVLPSTATAATRLWVNLAFLFTFFPSVLDVVFHSQTQPFAGFLTLPLLWMHPLELNRTTVLALIGIAVIVAYICGSLLVSPDDAFLILSNGVTYFTGAIFLLAMWDKLHLLDARVFRWSLAIWFVVGCVQFFPFPGAVKDAFTEVLRPIVSYRFTMDTYSSGAGGRGYILLASEPSISAPTVLYFGLTALFLRDRRKISGREFWLSLGQTGALALFNRSGNMVVLTLIAVLGLALDAVLAIPARRTRIMCFAVAAAAVVALVPIASSLPTTARGFNVLRQVITALLKLGNFHNFFLAMLVAGGQRTLQLAYGYGSLIDNHGLGHGIASWSTDWYLNRVIDRIGITQTDRLIGIAAEPGVQDKPATYFALISFDTGLLGLVPMLCAVFSAYTWRSRLPDLPKRRFVFLLPGTAWLLVFIVAAMISPWMMICYAMSYFRVSSPPMAPGPAAF